jgi:hypothetical protein
LKCVGKVATAIVYASFVVAPSPALAVDATANVVVFEGYKKIINKALRIARSKPALSVARTIVLNKFRKLPIFQLTPSITEVLCWISQVKNYIY